MPRHPRPHREHRRRSTGVIDLEGVRREISLLLCPEPRRDSTPWSTRASPSPSSTRRRPRKASRSSTSTGGCWRRRPAAAPAWIAANPVRPWENVTGPSAARPRAGGGALPRRTRGFGRVPWGVARHGRRRRDRPSSASPCSSPWASPGSPAIGDRLRLSDASLAFFTQVLLLYGLVLAGVWLVGLRRHGRLVGPGLPTRRHAQSGAASWRCSRRRRPGCEHPRAARVVHLPTSQDPFVFGRQPATVLLMGLLVLVAAPLGEEIFFRGFLLQGLARRIRFWPAAIGHLGGVRRRSSLALSVRAHLHPRSGLRVAVLAHRLPVGGHRRPRHDQRHLVRGRRLCSATRGQAITGRLRSRRLAGGLRPWAINTALAARGGIAQLGERRVRIAKARGSSPLTSTSTLVRPALSADMLEFTVTTPARDVLVDITGRIQEPLESRPVRPVTACSTSSCRTPRPA